MVDALSGRWSYHKERTDRQNIYYHVANALSLAISRIAPEATNRKREPITVNTKFDVLKPQQTITTNSRFNVLGGDKTQKRLARMPLDQRNGAVEG